MTRKPVDEQPAMTRRELLRRAGVAGAVAAAVPVGALAPLAVAPSAIGPASSAQNEPSTREVLETLTAAEADALEAMTARLIPTDENGPGAAEARAARYIDRALGGALASSLDAYRSGLAAVDAYAQAQHGAPFARLAPQNQDAVLRAMESNAATGFSPNAASFFNLVRTHAIQGTFCDPHYGGNANFVGWDLIGYPGIRLAVGASDQRLDPRLKPTHRSAYDHDMFSRKRPARASLEQGMSHGD
jgi:gluconate 2-dehydrogenase gamma chain